MGGKSKPMKFMDAAQHMKDNMSFVVEATCSAEDVSPDFTQLGKKHPLANCKNAVCDVFEVDNVQLGMLKECIKPGPNGTLGRCQSLCKGRKGSTWYFPVKRTIKPNLVVSQNAWVTFTCAEDGSWESGVLGPEELEQMFLHLANMEVDSMVSNNID